MGRQVELFTIYQSKWLSHDCFSYIRADIDYYLLQSGAVACYMNKVGDTEGCSSLQLLDSPLLTSLSPTPHPPLSLLTGCWKDHLGSIHIKDPLSDLMVPLLFALQKKQRWEAEKEKERKGKEDNVPFFFFLHNPPPCYHCPFHTHTFFLQQFKHLSN